MKHIGLPSDPGPARHPFRVAAVVMLVGLFATAVQTIGPQAAVATEPGSSDTGFAEPFAGTPQYEHVAPTEIRDQRQLNQALGQPAADEIAREIGLKRSDVLSEAQFRAFIAGQGVPGSGNVEDAKLVDQSVKILTNTVGHPLAYKEDDGHVVTSVLASYGLFVTTSGEIESPAYETAPTYLVNSVIKPTGYMASWMKANGATKSLDQLYKSAYASEVVYGNEAQSQSKPAELITTTEGDVNSVVGMSMGPSLWIVNFALIYTLNPAWAAEMPARWAPIPSPVVAAIDGGDGHVAYSTVAKYFH